MNSISSALCLRSSIRLLSSSHKQQQLVTKKTSHYVRNLTTTTTRAKSTTFCSSSSFSSSSSSNDNNNYQHGYFIWLGNKEEESDVVPSSATTTSRLLSEMKKTKLLLPVVPPLEPTIYISSNDNDNDDDTINDTIYHMIDEYYTEFITIDMIGTMGENDPGVCYSMIPSSNIDTLQYINIINSSINQIKEHRHGIPFGLYTTGVYDTNHIIWNEYEIDYINIPLLGSNIKQYQEISGIKNDNDAKKAFGYVCSTILNATENNIKVNVVVSSLYHTSQQQTSIRDLAFSLGVTDIKII